MFVVYNGFVNFVPVLDICIGTTAQAQHWSYEGNSYWLPNIDVESDKVKCEKCGRLYESSELHECPIQCDCCKGYFENQEAFDRHLRYNQVCNVFLNGGSNFDLDGMCYICGKSIDECTCVGGIGTGNRGDDGGMVGPGGGGNVSTDVIISSSGDLHTPDNSSDNSSEIIKDYCVCLITLNRKEIIKKVKKHEGKTDKMKGNVGFSEDSIKKSIEKQIGFPETVNQGQHGTCASALLQKLLAVNFPDEYYRCVCSLAETGVYEPWGLKLTKKCNLKSMSDADVSINGYTAVDAIMQSAIQTWANNNGLFEKIWNKIFRVDYGYNPKKDDGNGGGMSFDELEEFIHDNTILNKNTEFGDANTMSYEGLLKEKIDFSEYTVFGDVCVKINNDGKMEWLPSVGNHVLEITGCDMDGIHYWSWGKNDIIKKGYVKHVLYIKKTDYVKADEKQRKALVCHCIKHCTTGCEECVND